ncbi:hypothetical protein K503DRAFT_474998 [Rhizopogon vinicolor AM-OR11-026]|uniref:Uncharacterized protein n=1 Tax=Rhizopogon vinicolor AM-OR11-026 TaxID=1314800 RepID=A0A1B7MN51_9AGAM|nr:hypothetical protein K503DRAFT_474998 [Rhizopogon vinicolor AM-OR11-026]
MLFQININIVTNQFGHWTKLVVTTANSEIVVRGRPVVFEKSKNQKNTEKSKNSFMHYTHFSSLV